MCFKLVNQLDTFSLFLHAWEIRTKTIVTCLGKQSKFIRNKQHISKVTVVNTTNNILNNTFSQK